MFKFSTLVMVVALAIAIVGLQETSAQDMYHLCLNFNDELEKAVGASTDRESNYREAVKLLAGGNPLHKLERDRLASIWSTIRNDESCSDQADESLNDLRACDLDEDRRLSKTLALDAHDYVAKCSTKEVLDDKLVKSLARMTKSDREAMTSFISDKFIEDYSQSLPAEMRVSLVSFVYSISYRLDAASRAVLNSMIALHNQRETRNSIDGLDYFKKNVKSIGKSVENLLTKPCKKYVKATEKLMKNAEAVPAFYPGGDETFISAQSKDFRDAIFRYQFCLKFGSESNKKDLIKEIQAKLAQN